MEQSNTQEHRVYSLLRRSAVFNFVIVVHNVEEQNHFIVNLAKFIKRLPAILCLSLENVKRYFVPTIEFTEVYVNKICIYYTNACMPFLIYFLDFIK